MAQSNNAQREPSMEEILASIRRIIEDSDTTRRAAEAEAPEVEAPEVEAPPASDTGNVRAFRAGLHDDGESLESSSFAAPRREDFYGTETSFRKEPMAALPSGFDKHEEPAAGTDHAGDEIEVELGQAELAEAETYQSSAQPTDAPDGRSAIISDHAGRQVAASFNELAAAFDARSRRSFDEIAEGMMRPMLQDWLDNNLPHLVERLVREEIERIARGAPAQR